MKKKITLTLLALVCALCCVFGLTACNQDNDPYYNHTYTLTGECTIDWTGKVRVDTYAGEEKDVSQRQILEKHWEKIDWAKTAESAGVPETHFPHSSVDEFIEFFKSFEKNVYKDDAGLKLALTSADDLKLTVTFPEAMTKNTDFGKDYPAELTMPFAETAEQLAKIIPNNDNYHYEIQSADLGYSGIGIYKKDDTHFVTVVLSVGKYVDSIRVEIVAYTAVTEDGYNYLQSTEIFKTRDEVLTLYDSEGKSILDVRCKAGYSVA